MNTIETKNSNGSNGLKPEIVTVNNVRVFRPWECKAFINAIPKKDYRIKFEALLYSGMRYVELQRLLEKPVQFEPGNNRVHLNSYSVRKKLVKQKERYVILSPVGKRVIETFLETDKNLPDHHTWRENLTRWCKMANIDSNNMSSKTSRKTWESWLVTYYPQYTNHIFKSQGHSAFTALEHYITLPFNKQDKEEMREFVYGWEP